MTSEEHLQISDILAYRERQLSAEDHTMAARHLIRCPECRNQLPVPTADEFWNCLMGSDEKATEETIRIPVWIAIKESLGGVLPARPTMRNAVLASLLAIAILGFSALLMMPGGALDDENMVAAVNNTDARDIPDPMSYESPTRNEIVNSDDPVSSTASQASKAATAEQDVARSDAARNGRIPGRINDRRASASGSRRQAKTRGKTPCEGQRSVALEARQTDDGLLLTWEKVRNAVTYNVYLSDLDERLIDHFETDERTSYLVTAELDPETTYRLRLIVKLESGERIVSESQDFRMSDLKRKSQSTGTIKMQKKTTASVRCVEVKQ
ncbi:MAG: hypothetical protein KF855_11745 [Acidobacteria bacterium]|nr:hypothetical protein [Acidobacteriota bacterium]